MKTAEIIFQKAVDLHSSNNKDLEIARNLIEQDGLEPCDTAHYSILHDKIIFKSLAARNSIIASGKFNHLSSDPESKLENYFNEAQELWRHEIGEVDSAAGRLLGELHSHIDVISGAAGLIRNEVLSVFTVLHLIECAIPFCEHISADSIIELCVAQYEPTKNDLASGLIYNNIEKYLLNKIDLILEIYSKTKETISDNNLNLAACCIVALAKSSPAESIDLLENDIQSDASKLIQTILWAANKLITEDVILCNDRLQTLIVNCLHHQDDGVRRSAIRTIIFSSKKITKFADHAKIIVNEADQLNLATIIDFLYLNISKFDNFNEIQEWLLHLYNIKTEFRGSIEKLDYILSNLAKDESKLDYIIDFLSNLVEKNDLQRTGDNSFTKLFDSLTIEFANRPIYISKLITKWLLSEQRCHNNSVDNIISYLWVHNYRHVEFAETIIETLDKPSLLFLARKMLGYVHSHEILLSLSFSMVKYSNDKNIGFGIGNALFFDEIGYDYPLETIEFLKMKHSQEQSEAMSKFLSDVISKLEKFLNELDSLTRIKELAPPNKLQREIAKARNIQINVAFKEASKDSIFRQIATEIPIKAGLGTIHYYDNNYSESNKLSSISHSASLPRREVLDSIGNAIRLFGFKISKREEA